MHNTLKMLHFLAVFVFVGSIPSHILIGASADPQGDLVAFADAHRLKHLLTQGLTGAAIMVALASGALLVLANRALLRDRWLQAKLVLVAAVAGNGLLLLTPMSAEFAAMAQTAASTGSLPVEFAALQAREAVAGAANLALIAAIVALAVFRPRLRAAGRVISSAQASQ